MGASFSPLHLEGVAVHVVAGTTVAVDAAMVVAIMVAVVVQTTMAVPSKAFHESRSVRSARKAVMKHLIAGTATTTTMSTRTRPPAQLPLGMGWTPTGMQTVARPTTSPVNLRR